MTVPVVYSACMARPDVRFVMVTQKVASTLFINRPENLTVIGVDVKGEYRGPCGMFRLVRELRREYSIDLFIDLHDVIRTHLMSAACRLAGIPVSRIDKGRRDKRLLTRAEGKRLHPLISSRQRYFDTFARAGFSFGELFRSVYPDGVDRTIYSEITMPKAQGDVWIAVAPFAKHQGKIYPLGLMRTALDKILSAHPTARVFLFGGGGEERKALESWERSLPDRIVSLAGKRYGFARELALLSDCDVMVSMDSANMHLASLVGLPTVSVWGATHPYCGFTGWHQRTELEVQSDMPCRPCSVFGNQPCRRGDYACLRSINPAEIAARVDFALVRGKEK